MFASCIVLPYVIINEAIDPCNMGLSSSKQDVISVRPASLKTSSGVGSAPAAAATENPQTPEKEQEDMPIILPPRWVRDRNTGEESVEKYLPKADMLSRRGEATHVLRQQGKRFFTRHKDGTMQIDPKRRPIGKSWCTAMRMTC